jgi:hypothetical protein
MAGAQIFRPAPLEFCPHRPERARRLKSQDRTADMLEQLYGKHAAALYAQAADFNKTARFYYMKAQVRTRIY